VTKPIRKPRLTKEEIGWIAGFFQGEGSVRIENFRGHYHGHICVSQDEIEPLEYLQKHFGGSIHRLGAKEALRDNSQWKLHGLHALSFLRLVNPLIKSPTKVEEIKVFTTFMVTENEKLKERLVLWWKNRIRLRKEKGR